MSPTCGKTLLTKRIATEVLVPLLAMASLQFVEVSLALGSAYLWRLFEAACVSSSILFTDEMDAMDRKHPVTHHDIRLLQHQEGADS